MNAVILCVLCMLLYCVYCVYCYTVLCTLRGLCAGNCVMWVKMKPAAIYFRCTSEHRGSPGKGSLHHHVESELQVAPAQGDGNSQVVIYITDIMAYIT